MSKMVLVVMVSACAYAADDNVSAAIRASELLRTQMGHDPDFLVIEHVYAKTDHKPDHPLLCIPYRSRNGFGGYSHGVAEYKGGNNLNAYADQAVGWCGGIERNLQRALKRGWVDITDEYVKAAAARP